MTSTDYQRTSTAESAAVIETRTARFVRFAMLAVYCAPAVIFIWFGALKFTAYEASAIAGLILNSPFVGWWYSLLGIRGTATMLGWSR